MEPRAQVNQDMIHLRGLTSEKKRQILRKWLQSELGMTGGSSREGLDKETGDTCLEDQALHRGVSKDVCARGTSDSKRPELAGRVRSLRAIPGPAASLSSALVMTVSIPSVSFGCFPITA